MRRKSVNTFFIGFVLMFLFLILFWSNAFSGDTYNYAVTTKGNLESKLIYQGKIDMSDDTTGNHYTKWMYITDFNNNDAYIWAVCSEAGTEDVNVTAEYSMNADSTSTGFVAGTAIDGLDALGTTPKVDTVNVVTGTADVKFKAARMVRFKFDGQTGNGDTTVSWWFVLRRNAVYDQKAKGGTEKNKAINP